MLRLLVVDTCGTAGYVGVLDGSGALAERTLPGRGTQERLMPALQEVLREAEISLHELDVLAVVAGPGSFTGVRIGMAAVKGLAEALEKPVAALSRLLVLASAGLRESPHGSGQTVHAWLDAGRGDVFGGRYRTRPDGMTQTVDEVMRTRSEAESLVRDGEQVFALEPVFRGEAPSPVTATIRMVSEESFREAMREIAMRYAERGIFRDVALLDAEYLRVPDAELAMRSRMEAEGRTAR